jgi:rhodanese-related sulfurtransferase
VSVDLLANVYLGERSQIERVSMDELAARLARGSVVLLDVRPRPEYDAGHLPEALSAPIGELRGLLEQLPDAAETVAYCRGPYCVYADDAVRLLRAAGRAATRLDVGFPEWRGAGHPVALSA